MMICILVDKNRQKKTRFDKVCNNLKVFIGEINELMIYNASYYTQIGRNFVNLLNNYEIDVVTNSFIKFS